MEVMLRLFANSVLEDLIRGTLDEMLDLVLPRKDEEEA
jgi:hypothetical protein